MTSSNKVKGFAAGIVAAVCYGTNPLGTLELYGDGIQFQFCTHLSLSLGGTDVCRGDAVPQGEFQGEVGTSDSSWRAGLYVFALISYALCQFPLYGGRYCQHHPLRLSYYDSHPDDGLLPREGNVVYLACHSSGGIG